MKNVWQIITLTLVGTCVLLGDATSATAQQPQDSHAKQVGGPTLPYGELIGNGGFEEGFAFPWGTWVELEPEPLWHPQGGCKAEATADMTVKKFGQQSLRITNSSACRKNCFAETSQVMVTAPNRRYRITLWAQANGLASDGGVEIWVGLPGMPDQPSRPVIALPAGSYGWTKLTGEFTFPATAAELRIRVRDRGIVWLDGLHVTAASGDEADFLGGVSSDGGAAADLFTKQPSDSLPELTSVPAEDSLQIALPSGEVEVYVYDDSGTLIYLGTKRGARSSDPSQ